MTVAGMSGSPLPPTADELARAWDALRSGQFRSPQGPAPRPARRYTAATLLSDPGPAGTGGTAEVADTPIPGPVVLVVGAHGWSGASTTALLLAEAAARIGAHARLVDAADPATSGLVGAAVTEHGQDASGEWRRGSRTVQDAAGQARHLWLERLGWPTPSAYAVPDAAPAGSAGVTVVGAGLTVVDAGRPLTDLLRMAEDPTGRHHWLAQLLRTAPVVVTARATVAGIQRAGAAVAAVAAVRDLRGAAQGNPAGSPAEQAAELTPQHTSAQVLEQMLVEATGPRTGEADASSSPLVVALVGTNRLPKLLEDHLGATLPTITAITAADRGLAGRERLALLPTHADLTVQGVTSSELPRQLVPAATRLLHATGYRADPLTADPGDAAGNGRVPRRWRAKR